MSVEFFLFFLVGAFAQLVDGSLGMGYGVISSTTLLTLGVSPAQASASTHLAKLFTTAISGATHLFHRNVDRVLFFRLASLGMVGGVLGTYVLTSIDGALIKPWVIGYLALVGLYILARTVIVFPSRPIKRIFAYPLGAVGGFADAVGGGGWGPVVTSGLIGAGGAPRYVVGTVSAAEFVVTVAISSAFVVSILTGHWEVEAAEYGLAVLGLIIGGMCAAPFAGRFVKLAPARLMRALVGLLLISLSAYQAYGLWG